MTTSTRGYDTLKFALHRSCIQRKGLTLDQIFLAVNQGLKRAQDEYEMSSAVVEHGEPPFRYGIIACALRMFTEDTIGWYGRFLKNFYKPETKHIFGQASLELARNAVRCRDQYMLPIVGLDLAGQEEGYPAKHHKLLLIMHTNIS